MRLYLHFGYHKTGSSFLQTLFSRNRDYLQENGFYFPIAEREYDMRAGNISAGNGPELAKALKETDKLKCKSLLADYVTAGRKKKCQSILLSSENFFHALENDRALSILTNVANDSGIEQVFVLLYFRDPVSHALSTYKHRAKNGTITDFASWMEQEYETMELIQRFIKAYDKFPIRWTCRKYAPDSLHMAESAFSDWLGIRVPEIPEDDCVNASLSLSEILVMRAVKENNPSHVNFMKQAFGNMLRSEKADDSNIANNYELIASRVLNKYNSLIVKVNDLLPNSEKLMLTKPNESVDDSNMEQILLSKAQVKTIIETVETACKSEQMVQRVKVLIYKIFQKVNLKLKKYTV